MYTRALVRLIVHTYVYNMYVMYVCMYVYMTYEASYTYYTVTTKNILVLPVHDVHILIVYNMHTLYSLLIKKYSCYLRIYFF